MLKCSEKAFAMCPTRHLCESREEAVFTEFSECAAFNESVRSKTMPNIEKAITYFREEIDRCRRAPELNGCPMREEWQETIDVCELAIEALKNMECMKCPVE